MINDSFGYWGGFQAGRQNAGIQVVGLDEALAHLNAVSLNNRQMERTVNKIVRYAINQSKSYTKNHIRGKIKNDPRSAHSAVKSMVYKRIFGGNISLLSKRKRSNAVASLPPKTHLTGRGGNRRTRSKRTEDIMSYWGSDRGFILRFLNNGTKGRYIHTDTNALVNKRIGRGRTSTSVKRYKTGKRGRIEAGNWFADISFDGMDLASQKIAESIEDAIQKFWKQPVAMKTNYDVHDDAYF